MAITYGKGDPLGQLVAPARHVRLTKPAQVFRVPHQGKNVVV
jgi:hypothetical protein